MVYDLPLELQDAARQKLNETPETKTAALVAIRAKLAEMKYVPYRDDDDFFLRFLRQKKFRVDDAAESCRGYCDFLLENRAFFEGATWEETAAVFPTMGTMILPSKDVNGRYTNLVLAHKMRFDAADAANPQEYGFRVLRASLYLWELWLDDPHLQVHGVNVVQNFEGFSLSAMMEMQKVQTQDVQRLKMGFLKASPVRLASIIILEQPWYLSFIPFPHCIIVTLCQVLVRHARRRQAFLIFKTQEAHSHVGQPLAQTVRNARTRAAADGVSWHR